MRKSGERRGRPRNTYHVNDVRWTQGGCGAGGGGGGGGEGPAFK